MAYWSPITARNNQPIFAQLNDEDIDMIQAILDESEDDDDDDEVVFVNQNQEFPRPRKA